MLVRPDVANNLVAVALQGLPGATVHMEFSVTANPSTGSTKTLLDVTMDGTADAFGRYAGMLKLNATGTVAGQGHLMVVETIGSVKKVFKRNYKFVHLG